MQKAQERIKFQRKHVPKPMESVIPKQGRHPCNRDDAPPELVKLYKDRMGIKSELRVICDGGYLRYLYMMDNDVASIIETHDDVMKQFGVKNLKCHVTWCVRANMLEAAKAGNESRKKEWIEVEKFASQITTVCDHRLKGIDCGKCVDELLEKNLLEPCLFASTKLTRCRKILTRFGMPSLWVNGNGSIKIYPPKLNTKYELKMKELKENRDLALEKVNVC